MNPKLKNENENVFVINERRFRKLLENEPTPFTWQRMTRHFWISNVTSEATANRTMLDDITFCLLTT